MKKILSIFIVLLSLTIWLFGCESSSNNNLSFGTPPQEESSVSSVPDLETFSLVAFDLEGPGDLGIQIPMNQHQQEELLSLLQVEKWEYISDIPEVGFSPVLTIINVKQNQILSVSKFEEQTLIHLQKESNKSLYHAPAEVFHKAETFAQLFEQQEIPSTPNTNPPTLMVEDTLYTSTGKILVSEPAPKAILGTIESVVPGSQFPTENGQANFPAEGAEYAYINDGAHNGILVSINNEWTYFEAQQN